MAATNAVPNVKGSGIDTAAFSLPRKKYARVGAEKRFRSGRRHGPRDLRLLHVIVPPAVVEMLRALFDIHLDGDDGPRVDLEQNELFDEFIPITKRRQMHAGEVLESYVIESAPLIFGISYFDFSTRRDKGEKVNLQSLFESRHAELMGGRNDAL